MNNKLDTQNELDVLSTKVKMIITLAALSLFWVVI